MRALALDSSGSRHTMVLRELRDFCAVDGHMGHLAPPVGTTPDVSFTSLVSDPLRKNDEVALRN